MLVPDGGYMKENNISSVADPSNSNAIPAMAQALANQGAAHREPENSVDLLDVLGPPAQGLYDYLTASAHEEQNLHRLDKTLTPYHPIWVRKWINQAIKLLEEQGLIEEVIIKICDSDSVIVMVPLKQHNVKLLFYSLQMLLGEETIRNAIAEILVGLATAMAALDPNYINLPPANMLLYSLGVLLEEQNESAVKIAVAGLDKLYATETLKQQPQRLALLIDELKWHLLPDNKNHSAIEAVAKALRHLVSFLLMHLQSNKHEQSITLVQPIINLWGVLLIYLEDKKSFKELEKFPELYNLVINMTSINWVQAVMAILFNNPLILTSQPTATKSSITEFQNELLIITLLNLKKDSSPTVQDVSTVLCDHGQTVEPPSSVTKDGITEFTKKLMLIIGVVNLKLEGLLTDKRVEGLLDDRRAEILYGLSTIGIIKSPVVVDAVTVIIKGGKLNNLAQAFEHKNNIMPILNFIKSENLPVSELDFSGWCIKNLKKTLIKEKLIPLIRDTSLCRVNLIGELSEQSVDLLCQTLRKRTEPFSLIVDNPQWTDEDRAEYQKKLKKAAVCNQSKAMLLGYTLSAAEQGSLQLYDYFKDLQENVATYCASTKESEASCALQKINSKLTAILSEVAELFKTENVTIKHIHTDIAILNLRIVHLKYPLTQFQNKKLNPSQQEMFNKLSGALLNFLPEKMLKQAQDMEHSSCAGSLIALVQLLTSVSVKIHSLECLNYFIGKKRKNTTTVSDHLPECNSKKVKNDEEESAPVTVYPSAILNFVAQAVREAKDVQADCSATEDDNGESSSYSHPQYFAP